MTSSHRRFGTALLVVSLASLLPATVGAQAPVYLAQWGTPGSANGEFNKPYRVAVDAAGDVYVVDFERESLGGNSRIQKFTSAGDYLTQWRRIHLATSTSRKPPTSDSRNSPTRART